MINISDKMKLYLIHPQLKAEPIAFRKALVLTYVHLFIAIFALIIYLTCSILSLNNDPALLLGVLICIILMWIFKTIGSLILSSNLLALLFFALLGTSVPRTGGLFSDNLLWIFLSPLIGLLFGNKKSGFFWLCCLLLFSGYLYFDNSSNIALLINQESDITYYFISYSFLFVFVYGIAIIFETGQSLIIKMLNEKKVLLEQQKLEISQKNEELEAAQEQLKIKNGELENFAFAAAHDLKEPLRMIGMYTMLSKKRINGQLDKTTTEYFNYVTDGIDRMQKLLDDLLQYSRMGKSKDDIKDVDLNAIIFVVIHNMMATMKDTQASITINQLPIVEGATSEMMQLFQNLIANSIKFRKTTTLPEIKISATDEGENYLISLNDNGIGIKEEFQERVFAIFERAHARHEYEGSGIGLATCKKIVESTGGKIWLKSTEGEGTTFFFTFPKSNMN